MTRCERQLDSDRISWRLSSNLRSDDDESSDVLGRQTGMMISGRVSMSNALVSCPPLLGRGGVAPVPIGSFLSFDNYPGMLLLDNIDISLSASEIVSLQFTTATTSTRISSLMCDSRSFLACCIVHSKNLETVPRNLRLNDHKHAMQRVHYRWIRDTSRKNTWSIRIIFPYPSPTVDCICASCQITYEWCPKILAKSEWLVADRRFSSVAVPRDLRWSTTRLTLAGKFGQEL